MGKKRFLQGNIQEAETRLTALERTQRGIVLSAESGELTGSQRRDLQGLEAKINKEQDALTEMKRELAILTEQEESAKRRVGETYGDAGGSTPHNGPRGVKFSGLGEMCSAVARATVPGGAVDSRLEGLASGLHEGIGSQGGFLVESAMASDMLQKVIVSGEILKRVRRIPLTRPNVPGVRIPFIDETSRTTGNRLGGVRAFWQGETDTITPSKPKLGLMDLQLGKLAALCYVSNDLLADAGTLEAVLFEAFRREMVFEAESKIVEGGGAGLPQGILTAPCTVTVPKETGQTAATINAANVVKMLSRLHPASWPNAVWLANVDTLPQLLQLSVPVKNVAGTENVGGAGLLFDLTTQKLLGRPLLFVEHAKTLGTAGDLALVDLAEYLLVDQQIQAASSMHVAFVSDEMAFRFTWRVNGQPAWKSALTPANGSATTSPFVTLATRA